MDTIPLLSFSEKLTILRGYSQREIKVSLQFDQTGVWSGKHTYGYHHQTAIQWGVIRLAVDNLFECKSLIQNPKPR
jgi:hypothetical protein